MRTFVTPIGYDTRRVSRPVINTGLGPDDSVRLLRPNEETDTERAMRAVADLEQLLQEIEPGATCTVERISTETFETTVRDCCSIIAGSEPNSDVLVSLGGGPRDVLLPLTVASLVLVRSIDLALFFSDLDNSVREWPLPDLSTGVPDRATSSFETIAADGGWLSLSEIAAETDQSKSTVVRHVNDLEEAGLVEADTSEKTKRVRIAFAGELRAFANSIDG